MKLKNKVSVITGASLGLGKEIARLFAENGSHLILVARTKPDLDKTAKELRANFPDSNIMAFSLDVRDLDKVETSMRESIAELGKIDILVNNAGVQGKIGNLDTISMEDWKLTFEINFYGTLNFCHTLIPYFKKQNHGKIINLSGGGGTNPRPLFSSYSCSKTAIIRLTENIAEEYKSNNIFANSVAPGAMNTRMLTEVLEAGSDIIGEQNFQQSLKQKETGGIPPIKAANLCLYLASNESDGVTGKLISAVWDDWQTLKERLDIVNKSDMYTLRRITSKDRGYNWDK